VRFGTMAVDTISSLNLAENLSCGLLDLLPEIDTESYWEINDWTPYR
jgi:hypothetical protein